MHLRNCLTILLLVIATPPLVAQAPGSSRVVVPTDLDDVIQQEMERRQIPGLALAIAQHGKVLTERGFGMACVGNRVPVQPETRFALASLTKQFTAVGVMMRVEAGRLDLDASIRRYLPEDSPLEWEPVTVRHLLTHTSGLPPFGRDFGGDPAMYGRVRIDRMMSWAAARGDRLVAQPGDRWAYSDVGYFLLGMITEAAAEQPWRSFMEERIFAPLGMKSTYHIDPYTVREDVACGYTLRDGVLATLHRPWAFELPSHFGIFSNVRDLVRWDAAVAAGGLVGESSRREMWSPVRLTDGRHHPYGFGWEVREICGRIVLRHTGVTGTELVSVPEVGLTVAVLTNLGRGFGGTADSWGIARDVASMSLSELRCDGGEG